MRRSLVPLLAGALLAASADAHAFCRTTTASVPPGYDPTSRGCIQDGVPLAWPSAHVTYQIDEQASAQVSLADATPILDRAFAKWASVSCSASDPTQHPFLSFENGGATDAGYAPCEGGPCGAAAQDAPHVIVFRDQSWPYNDPSNTLALTTVTYGVETGHVFAADMEINTNQHRVSTAVPPPAGEFSLEAIVTHEAGHFIGVAHSQDGSAVMFARYQPGAITLTSDDVDAVCAIYPPGGPPPAKGCACTMATRGEGGTSCVIAVAVVGALARRRRRRGR